MVERLRLDSTAASPMRVSAGGADVNGAEFNSLIFDANQAPMRLWATGWFILNGITDTEFVGGKNINVGAPGASFPATSGREALFITMTKLVNPASNPNGQVITPWMGPRQGGGGGMCSGQFVGANMYAGLAGSGGAPGPQIYSQYCVFKNDN